MPDFGPLRRLGRERLVQLGIELLAGRVEGLDTRARESAAELVENHRDAHERALRAADASAAGLERALEVVDHGQQLAGELRLAASEGLGGLLRPRACGSSRSPPACAARARGTRRARAWSRRARPGLARPAPRRRRRSPRRWWTGPARPPLRRRRPPLSRGAVPRSSAPLTRSSRRRRPRRPRPPRRRRRSARHRRWRKPPAPRPPASRSARRPSGRPPAAHPTWSGSRRRPRT